MTIQLSEKEVIYLYGTMKKTLCELESAKPKSLVKTDIQLYNSILKSLESSMPQLKNLPL